MMKNREQQSSLSKYFKIKQVNLRERGNEIEEEEIRESKNTCCECYRRICC